MRGKDEKWERMEGRQWGGRKEVRPAQRKSQLGKLKEIKQKSTEMGEGKLIRNHVGGVGGMACLPPIQMWNNSCLSVCQHLQACRE